MKRSTRLGRRLTAGLTLGAWLWPACSLTFDSDVLSSGAGGSGGSGGSGVEAGATGGSGGGRCAPPTCSECADCMSRCLCATAQQDASPAQQDACAKACGAGATGGAGGSGNVGGTSGTGNTGNVGGTGNVSGTAGGGTGGFSLPAGCWTGATPKCQPLTNEGCTGTDACDYGLDGSNVPSLTCWNGSNALDVGDACDDAAGDWCKPKLHCTNVGCAHFCCTAADCSSGANCVAIDAQRGTLGSCLIPGSGGSAGTSGTGGSAGTAGQAGTSGTGGVAGTSGAGGAAGGGGVPNDAATD